MRKTTAAPVDSAEQTAALIASGERSALQVIEAAIERIEAVNPALNAVVYKRYDDARDEARAIDTRRARSESLGPLAGVPVTVKESLDLAGSPSTFGLTARRSHRAEADETHVARLKAAGAIVLGKTNVAQLLAFVESDNPVYGRTNNPWNLDRSCGGSSGGEGAIIAAGGSALGLGTDIGGSVRYPANFCGIASLKPTGGRCDDPGLYSFHPGQRAVPSQVGLLARRVADVALGLTAINGEAPLGDWRSVDMRLLRVGCYSDDGVLSSSPSVRRSVREAAAALEAAGASVVPWQPPEIRAAMGMFYRLLGGDGARWFREVLRNETVQPALAPILATGGRPGWLLRGTAGILRRIGQTSLADMLPLFARGDVLEWWKVVEAQREYQLRFARSMDEATGGPIDLILGPACSVPAFRHGASKDLGLAGAHTLLYNLLGYPAGIVPWSRVRVGEESDRPGGSDVVKKAARKTEEASTGLPVGVQISARPWKEHLALAAMGVIERAALRQPDFPVTPIDPR